MYVHIYLTNSLPFIEKTILRQNINTHTSLTESERFATIQATFTNTLTGAPFNKYTRGNSLEISS